MQIADTPLSASAIAQLRRRVGGFLTSATYANVLTARVATSAALAQELVNDPFVLGVEAYAPLENSDERQALSVTGVSSPVGGNYLNWLAGRDITPNALTTSGIIVDVADTGMDTGCQSSGHPDLAGRKVYFKGPVYAGSTDSMRHGTIVAGIVAGNPVAGITTANGATLGTGIKDSDSKGSFYYGLGIAPGTRIGLTRMIDPNGEQGTAQEWTTAAVTSFCNTPTALCTDTTTLCRAVVQTHSHNEYASAGGAYTTMAREFDISVRNADRATGVSLAMTVSAGNYNQGGNTSVGVLAPATAKNVISMGATESVRDGIPSNCQIENQLQNENALQRNRAEGYNVIAYCSRRGTLDGRIKPDLLAPATLALGPRPQTVGATYCAEGGTTPGMPEYHGASGTSFAAPVAAGAIALLRFHYGSRGLVPSPAMYKAMLVAGARSLTGATDRLLGGTVGQWPNPQQGFGTIDLTKLLRITPANSWHDQGTVLTQGQMFERTLTVDDPNQAVRIVMAYTDAPGSTAAPETIVNGLNMSANWSDGSRLYGNYTGADGYSAPAPGCGRPSCTAPSDVKNNVEAININPTKFATVANRTFTIRIIASPLYGIGVPGQSGGANNQDFALFVINGTLQ